MQGVVVPLLEKHQILKHQLESQLKGAHVVGGGGDIAETARAGVVIDTRGQRWKARAWIAEVRMVRKIERFETELQV